MLVGDATVGKTHLLSRYVKGETNGGHGDGTVTAVTGHCEEMGRFIAGSSYVAIFVDWLSAIGTLPKAPTATIGVEFATRQGLKIVRAVKCCKVLELRSKTLILPCFNFHTKEHNLI